LIGIKKLETPIDLYDFSNINNDFKNNPENYKKSYDQVCVTLNISSSGDAQEELEGIIEVISQNLD
jgi:hypothetical protein